MNEAMNTLLTRRSVRKFTDQQVEDALLDQVLEAGLYAPSGMNTQNTVMVAVRDAATVAQLSKMNAAVMGTDSDPFYGAKCVVIVFVEAERYTRLEDGALVMGNMMNAAHALGLGSCWIHRAGQMFETEEGKELMRKWGVKEDMLGVANCILGYPAETPAARPRKKGRIIKV